ncbi:flagellar protein FlaG [Shewanella sp. AC91-MNA-CIBAN-0169]|jgi:flagellar protein FlaG|uniref:flagellar protein FlaG n=1 Tax=Shewanella sp. AC91-MNA-CIBAN-0169 TaxID=3140466 RepID=UPI00332C652C
MEINSSVQFKSNSSASKAEQQIQLVSSKPELEQNILNEASIVESVGSATKAHVAEADTEQLQQVAVDLTNMVAMMQKGLKFSVDDDSGKQVIKVQDIESGDIIRQIPSEEALQLAKKISEVSGVLMPIEV